MFWLLWALLLLPVVWLTWWPRRRYAIVVYSNSPVWQEYFERDVIPQLGNRAVVLNWSERQTLDTEPASTFVSNVRRSSRLQPDRDRL